MKKTNFVSPASCGDPMTRLNLMHVFELEKELEVKRMNLDMMKQKRLILKAEVRFLRRRYELLKQEQTLERLSESGRVEVPSKPSGERKKHSTSLRAAVPCFDLKQKNTVCNERQALANDASCDLEKKLKRSRGDDALSLLTNPVSLPDLNREGNTFVTNKIPGFDLNQISREEEDEPQANGEQHMVVEATNDTMVGNGINDLKGERELSIYKDVEKELNRTVKRKVSWQDPVALSV